MPGVDFEAVRSAVSITQVLRLLGFTPTSRKGDQVRGHRPLHEIKARRTSSFSANLRKNVYRCFICRSAGNQLDLWTAATKQELHDAAIDLCRKLHVPVPWVHRQ